MTGVRLEGVTKKFDRVAAVDNVSISIAPGELFFLLGPSGCGKTTLLRMIAGFYPCDGGEIYFDDRSMAAVEPNRRNCGFVFQNYALWPHLSVFENVAYGLKVRKIAKSDVATRVAQALSMVQLQGYEARRPTQLSGGQQQRVALARALVIHPDVLLLDEPLSNLDAKLRLEMRDEIRRIHQELKITTIYVTHEQKEALSLADRVAVMNRGRVEQVGTPRELYVVPASPFVAGFIGETNFVEGAVSQGQGVSTSLGTLRLANGLASKAGKVILSIRPEACRLGAKISGDLNLCEGVVERSTYLGDQEQLIVAVGDLRLKILNTDPGKNVHPEGSKIRFQLPPESLALFTA